jgi:hypothetical protein
MHWFCEEVVGKGRCEIGSGEKIVGKKKCLHLLYSSTNVVMQSKARRMRWAEHVARMERREKCKSFWWESLKEEDHLKDRGVDGIRMNLGEIGWRVCTGFSWLRVRTGGGLV